MSRHVFKEDKHMATRHRERTLLGIGEAPRPHFGGPARLPAQCRFSSRHARAWAWVWRHGGPGTLLAGV